MDESLRVRLRNIAEDDQGGTFIFSMDMAKALLELDDRLRKVEGLQANDGDRIRSLNWDVDRKLKDLNERLSEVERRAATSATRSELIASLDRRVRWLEGQAVKTMPAIIDKPNIDGYILKSRVREMLERLEDLSCTDPYMKVRIGSFLKEVSE